MAIGGRSKRSLNEAPGSITSVLEKFAIHLFQDLPSLLIMPSSAVSLAATEALTGWVCRAQICPWKSWAVHFAWPSSGPIPWPFFAKHLVAMPTF